MSYGILLLTGREGLQQFCVCLIDGDGMQVSNNLLSWRLQFNEAL